MASELWEIVRADELKVGDVYVPHASRGVDPSEITSIALYEGTDVLRIDVLDGCHDWMENSRKVLRRYTGPSPEVLMRALRIAASWFTNRFAYASVDEEVKKAIAQAEDELAEEVDND